MPRPTTPMSINTRLSSWIYSNCPTPRSAHRSPSAWSSIRNTSTNAWWLSTWLSLSKPLFLLFSHCTIPGQSRIFSTWTVSRVPHSKTVPPQKSSISNSTTKTQPKSSLKLLTLKPTAYGPLLVPLTVSSMLPDTTTPSTESRWAVRIQLMPRLWIGSKKSNNTVSWWMKGTGQATSHALDYRASPS